MLTSLALWLTIMTLVMVVNRGEKRPTEQQVESLNRQSAYAAKRRV